MASAHAPIIKRSSSTKVYSLYTSGKHCGLIELIRFTTIPFPSIGFRTGCWCCFPLPLFGTAMEVCMYGNRFEYFKFYLPNQSKMYPTFCMSHFKVKCQFWSFDAFMPPTSSVLLPFIDIFRFPYQCNNNKNTVIWVKCYPFLSTKSPLCFAVIRYRESFCRRETNETKKEAKCKM